MRWIIGIAGIGFFALTAMAFVPGGYGSELEADALTALAVMGAGGGVDCGEEYGCLGGEHKIVSNGQPIGTWLGPHDCTGPGSHSSPPCDPTFVTANQVRQMSHAEVMDYIAREDGNLAYNERWAAVDVLNCSRSLIVARVPVAALAE